MTRTLLTVFKSLVRVVRWLIKVATVLFKLLLATFDTATTRIVRQIEARASEKQTTTGPDYSLPTALLDKSDKR